MRSTLRFGSVSLEDCFFLCINEIFPPSASRQELLNYLIVFAKIFLLSCAQEDESNISFARQEFQKLVWFYTLSLLQALSLETCSWFGQVPLCARLPSVPKGMWKVTARTRDASVVFHPRWRAGHPGEVALYKVCSVSRFQARASAESSLCTPASAAAPAAAPAGARPAWARGGDLGVRRWGARGSRRLL